MRDTDKVRVKAVAIALFDEALAAQKRGDFDRALHLYSRSLAIYPTAEAYTYRGWVRSFFGHYEEAIEDCRRAIEVDPEYGNPYNDIGAYLIELGRYDDAVGWLRKAIRAPRYEPRCFPYLNLGRIYLAKSQLLRALRCVNSALEHYPDYPPAVEMAEMIERKIN